MLKLVNIMIGLLVIAGAQANTLRDPTMPLDLEQTLNNTDHGLRLSLVLASGKDSKVVINGKVLKIGDVIQGYRVISVETQQVTLKRGPNDQDAVTLSLSDAVVKKPSNCCKEYQ